MPQLDTEKIAATRCLLLGAGTLGCAVARLLLGWGVTTISLVDSGTVSYSNPVRQSLFVHKDCIGGATRKALAAAEALRQIYPNVQAEGHVLSIPMPGHAVSPAEEEQARAESQQLAELVQAHDVIFMLTDTRESRWLPTVLAAAMGKLAITAALGFDSFLVMRHGELRAGEASGRQLGCYFCNDVVAPANSLQRRTLDQQCTVSRPGLSMVASALAVELMVTLLHHPLGASAPADLDDGEEAPPHEVSPLGAVPHQVRGFLSAFRTDCMRGAAFDKCTACSRVVVDAYKSRGFDFVRDALNHGSYLEDLTGLSAMQKQAEAALESLSFFDEADDEEDLPHEESAR